MSQETTTIRILAHNTDTPSVGSTAAPGEGGTGSGSLLPQVNGWAATARESRSACVRAAEAAQKLRTRRNTSGE